MDRPQIPLNALRAFEAAARHRNFTRAAIELCVSQAALSHQIKGLEARLGVQLFRRLPRGVLLTDEGEALVPVLGAAFDSIGATLDRFVDGRYRAVLAVGVVGTFAVGWLLPRLTDFAARHPAIDLRVMTNNNRADLAAEGLDLAVRFGDGDWPGVLATLIMPAPMIPMAAPNFAGQPIASLPLLRSYRAGEWQRWFAAAGLPCPVLQGPLFDSGLALAIAAAGGAGVALLPAPIFAAGRVVPGLVPLSDVTIDVGSYWLTRARSRPETAAMAVFRDWLEAGGAR
ncbi:LysR substrate-binding domain-containing protein [Sandarakinorhabdus sp. DWP1-3-1]|uniref:LysR substrate-binding domain-containing protein n=1 Tax=Sandarakinorhabdus sp. DWP1-3-1 TaxID=2804627 RepID=UPI003CFB82CE